MNFIQAIQESLKDGEKYAGIILGKDGNPSHHLILLPNKSERVNWEQAKEWAATVEGDLPTRCEQSLLYANLKEEFRPTWHWSCEQHTSTSDFAWLQYFDNGYQYDNDKSYECRARAVRRLEI